MNGPRRNKRTSSNNSNSSTEESDDNVSGGGSNSFKKYNSSLNKTNRYKGTNSLNRHRSGDGNKINNNNINIRSEEEDETQTPDPGGIDNPGYDHYGDPPSTNRYSNNPNPRAKVKHKSKGGKRYPLTPTPLPPSHFYNIPYSDPAAINTMPLRKLKSPRDNDNDTDLIDYDDYGSSSSSTASTSSGNSSEQEEEEEINISNSQQTNTKPDSSDKKDAKNETYYGKFNGSNWDRRRSSAILYDKFTGLRRETSGGGGGENGPCSSSSLREPLNNSNSNNSNLGSSKVSPIGSSATSTSKRNGSDKTTSLRKSASPLGSVIGEVEEEVSRGASGVDNEFDPSNPKYAFSGVGRHFGRKSTNSLLDLTDEEGAIGGEVENTPRTFYGIDVFGYLTRLKAVSIVFLATLFILSSSSLLFVFPIIIDPILLGMEAQFSRQPVQCRTTNVRNGTGAGECVVPSCREGCTADLFSCFFIDVKYQLSSQTIDNYLNINETNNNYTTNITTTSFNDSSTIGSDVDKFRWGTLLININGCGYPPDVNCSEFRKLYGKLDTVFPCFYSQVNESLVVPYYNYGEEKTHLIIGLSVPFGLAIFSAISLIFLLKCRGGLGLSTNKSVDKNSSSLKLLEKSSAADVEMNHQRYHSKLNGVSNSTHNNKASTDLQINGSVAKANGHAKVLNLQDTMAGLIGMSGPQIIQESIKSLPHQRDSFDKSMPYLNGSVPNPRKSRYAKNKKILSRGQSVDDPRFHNNRQDRNNLSSEDDEL